LLTIYVLNSDGAEVVGSDGDRDANKLTSLSPGIVNIPHQVTQIACGLQHSSNHLNSHSSLFGNAIHENSIHNDGV